MLKWLVAGKEGEGEDSTITDDPLATLNLRKNKKRSEIYSVSRFNPLYEEEVINSLDISDSMSDEQETVSSGGNSSSGYGSNHKNTGSFNREEKSKAEIKLHVSKMMINSDATEKCLEPSGSISAINKLAIPTPVWPDPEADLRGSLPLNSGHVADQVQRLNVIYLHENDITRPRDFVTSISIESDESKEHIPLEKNVNTSKMFLNGSSKLEETIPVKNSFGGTIPRQNSIVTKQALILKSSQMFKNKNNDIKQNKTSPVHERAWPGNNLNYSERSNNRIPAMLESPGITGRCFDIRHKLMSPIGEDAEKDTQMHDSIVTNSLLMMTSSPPTTVRDSEERNKVEVLHQNDKHKEMNNHELTRSVILDRNASTLSRVVKHARRSFRGSKRSQRSSKQRSVRNKRVRKGGSRTGSLRSGSGVEAVRELWEKTGMKTNGRKLLIESEDEAANDNMKAGNQGHYNDGYMSDGSEVSVPRMKGIRKLPETRHRNSGSQSSTSSYDSLPRSRPRLVRNISDDSGDSKWEVHGSATMNGLDVVDLDTVRLENDSDNSAKHVRFSSRTRYSPANSRFQSDHLANSLSSRLVSRVGAGELDRGKITHAMWERYYGATDPSIMESGLGPGRMKRNSDQRKSTSTLGSELIMDNARSGLLRKKEKKRKKLKCFCKMFCFLLLLSSFLLVIVAVSFFLTKGKNYFGAL